MNKVPARIQKLRSRIDDIDTRLVELLSERVSTAMEIGRAKQSGKSFEIYVPAREKAVLDRVQRLNKGPIPVESIKAIYREIMSASLAIEKATKVAYMGPLATYSHHAARSRFGSSVEYVACETVPDVFRTVEKHHADYGVVPIENSIHGPEAQTLDNFVTTKLKVCAEIVLPISHCLLSRSPRTKITKIYSHPQPFGQCTRWLRMEMPGVELVPTSSTAKAAELASVEHGSAALASSLAAEIYDLNIIAEGVEDETGNQTRFMVLARRFGHATGEDKTSIIFAVKHSAGSLYSALESFKTFKLNMTKIESRPFKSRAWEYYFFVDFEGHVEDKRVSAALRNLSKHCAFLTVLGSYPKAS